MVRKNGGLKMNLDRRFLWILYLVFIAYPFINPIGLPLKVDVKTQSSYDQINALKPGSRIMINAALAGMSLPELYPLAKVIIQHLISKPDFKLVFMVMEAQNVIYYEQLFSEIDTMGKLYGRDYVYLGYTPGGVTAIAMMADNLLKLVSVDYKGTPFDQLPDNGAILKGITSAKDFDLLLLIQGGGAGGFESYMGPW
jgi:hypothetical protein